MKESGRRSDCPISSALEIWGDKWSLLIIRDLMFSKQRTYSDFLKSEERIATNILAARLQMLEEHGLIERFMEPDTKSKVVYGLTEKGIDLVPVLVEINLWSEKYFQISAERQQVLDAIHENKARFIRSAMTRLRSA